MNHDRSLDRLRRLRWLLDEAFRIPGTRMRFGWDPIIGLVPWVGDVVAALLSCAVIVQAHCMRLSRVVQLRMLLNVGIDVVLGVVPLFGDVADLFWKSNSRNFALLERHAAGARKASWTDWLFVAGVVAAVLLMAMAPIVVLYWVATRVTQQIW